MSLPASQSTNSSKYWGLVRIKEDSSVLKGEKIHAVEKTENDDSLGLPTPYGVIPQAIPVGTLWRRQRKGGLVWLWLWRGTMHASGWVGPISTLMIFQFHQHLLQAGPQLQWEGLLSKNASFKALLGHRRHVDSVLGLTQIKLMHWRKCCGCFIKNENQARGLCVRGAAF